MKRAFYRVVLAVLATLAVFSPSASAQTAEELTVDGIDATGFPLVRALVSGPAVTGELDEAFTVVEDGEPVAIDVVRLREDNLNVVVAIDVSASIREALPQAKAAVAELLATLPESVPVSVVSFGETATAQSPFTVDRAATQSAVDQLVAAGGTALHDGIGLALGQLAAQGGTGALVVVADGTDTTSATSADDTVAALAASGTDVTFVALETESFDAGAVQGLAGAAGGSVIAIGDAGEFADALRDVAASLGNAYELRWRSASEGDEAEVQVALADDPSQSVTQTFAHDAVRRFVPDIADDPRTVASGGLLAAGWVPLVGALAVSAGAAVLVLLMRSGEGAVARREDRLSTKSERKDDRKRRFDGVQDKLNDISAQVLEANGRGRSLDDTLDRAGLSVRSNEFVVMCAGVVVVSLLVGVALFGIPYFLLAGLVPSLGIPLFLKILTSRRRKKFVGQLGDTLQLMAGSLTAGYGLGQTLDSVAREADSPTAEEFSRVVMETRLGRSLEDALDAMSYRINAPDFDWVVDAIKIQSSVGGNLSEIIEQVGDTIRARTRIKRQVDALTAEGKISALVLFVLPFGLAGFIFMSNPTYIMPLFQSTMGYVLVGTAFTLLTLGGLWLRKLVNPEF